MEEVATKVHEFFAEKAKDGDFKFFLQLRICGYSAGRPLPEVWQVGLQDGTCPAPVVIQGEQPIGTLWNGEFEAMDRIILGRGTNFVAAATTVLGFDQEKAAEVRDKISEQLYQQLILAAAPIQDAIDLARFMVETTKGFIRFSVNRPKTVSGPTEIAAITKHEGFRWVQRKYFFPRDLNLPI